MLRELLGKSMPDDSPSAGLGGRAWEGDRGSSKCSRVAIAGAWFVPYISHVLIWPWHGRICHPGCVGTHAGFGKISSLKKSPSSHPPAGPGSQALSLFAGFSQS